MAVERLTDKRVASAKAPDGGRLELWDSEVRGLCLRVSDNAKVWVFRYRRADGTQPRFKIGSYSPNPVEPEAGGEPASFTLAGARIRARKIRGVVDDGGDPSGARRVARQKAKAEPIKTFGDLATAYFAACKSGEWKPKGRAKRESTITDEERIYRVHIEPVWKSEPLDRITRPKVRDLLRDIKAKGLTTRTNRAHALIRQAFAYALSEDRLAANPAIGFAPLVTEKARARILTDAELKALWHALTAANTLWIERPDAEPERVYLARSMAITIQLAALLLQRRSEVAGMAVAELDLDQGTWLIPPERMKGARPHMVPLPQLSVALIKEAIGLRKDGKSPYVFPRHQDASEPMRGDSVTHSFGKVCKAIGLEGISLHDLRRTGSTALTSERLGVSPFIRSLVLGHSDTGGGAAVSIAHYDRNSYLSEKRKALAGWEALVRTIVLH